MANKDDFVLAKASIGEPERAPYSAAVDRIATAKWAAICSTMELCADAARKDEWLLGVRWAISAYLVSFEPARPAPDRPAMLKRVERISAAGRAYLKAFDALTAATKEWSDAIGDARRDGDTFGFMQGGDYGPIGPARAWHYATLPKPPAMHADILTAIAELADNAEGGREYLTSGPESFAEFHFGRWLATFWRDFTGKDPTATTRDNGRLEGPYPDYVVAVILSLPDDLPYDVGPESVTGFIRRSIESVKAKKGTKR